MNLTPLEETVRSASSILLPGVQRVVGYKAQASARPIWRLVTSSPVLQTVRSDHRPRRAGKALPHLLGKRLLRAHLQRKLTGPANIRQLHVSGGEGAQSSPLFLTGTGFGTRWRGVSGPDG